MRNLDQRAAVYAQRECYELGAAVDAAAASGGGMAAAGAAIATSIERAFRDGAMCAEQESIGTRPSARQVVQDDGGVLATMARAELARRILAMTVPAESTEHARGYNHALREAALLVCPSLNQRRAG